MSKHKMPVELRFYGFFCRVRSIEALVFRKTVDSGGIKAC